MQAILFALLSVAAAAPSGTMMGVATFNDYIKQGQTVCGGLVGKSGTYGTAISDISPIWSIGQCSGTLGDQSKCNGGQPISGYEGPPCPTGNCGRCFEVCNAGGIGGQVGGIGNCVKVSVIDVCPASSAYNYCKANLMPPVPANQRCGDSSLNAFDIDYNAYQALTGQPFHDGVPNLNIKIQDIGVC